MGRPPVKIRVLTRLNSRQKIKASIASKNGSSSPAHLSQISPANVENDTNSLDMAYKKEDSKAF